MSRIQRLPGQQPVHTITGRLIEARHRTKAGLHMHELLVQMGDADGDHTTTHADVLCHMAHARDQGEAAAAFAARVGLYLGSRVLVTGSRAPYIGANGIYMVGVRKVELAQASTVERRAA